MCVFFWLGGLDKMSVEKKLLLDVKDFKVYFNIILKLVWLWIKFVILKVVDGVNVCLYEGEILGVVGELGCGKLMFVCVIIGLV